MIAAGPKNFSNMQPSANDSILKIACLKMLRQNVHSQILPRHLFEITAIVLYVLRTNPVWLSSIHQYYFNTISCASYRVLHAQ